MKIRVPFEPRASWRERFVQIAREVQGARAPRRLVVAAGLKLKMRTSAFAAGRRSRLA